MQSNKVKLSLILMFLLSITTCSFAAENKIPKQKISAAVAEQIFDKAKENDNWKVAFLTGKHGQIVFMSVSPQTNPNNEIGMETHPFDQFIMVVSGKGKAVLDGKEFSVKKGDMIFIPLGTKHNVINLNKNEALKIISFYSNNDIPANAVFKTKADD